MTTVTLGHHRTTAVLSKTQSVRTILTARESSSSAELRTAWTEQATAATIVESTGAHLRLRMPHESTARLNLFLDTHNRKPSGVTVTCLKSSTLMGVPRIPRIVARRPIPVVLGREVSARCSQNIPCCQFPSDKYMFPKTAIVTGVLFLMIQPSK